jgi:hypothetical protein
VSGAAHSSSDAKEEGSQSQVVAFPQSPESPSYNLPLGLSSFIGREREMSEVKWAQPRTSNYTINRLALNALVVKFAPVG